MIKERLTEDLKGALKRGDSDLVSTLRFLLAQIQNEEIDSRGRGGSETLSEEVVTAVLKTEVKRRNEASLLFKEGGRNDLVGQEEKAVRVIRNYLPPELSREKIVEVVRRLRANGFNEFSTLMRETMAELKGRAGGREVSEVVKEVINE
jgi:uncharacterized protein YqeY